MSDELSPEIDSSASVAEATPPQAAAPESASPPTGNQQYDGFDSPYSAFKALPQFQGQDDITIARNLYQSFNGYQEATRQLEQYRQVVPYAQEYLRNQREFEAWRKAQAEAAKPKEPEKKRWFSPPEIDESIKGYIIRDPQTGREVIDPNAPLHAKEALRQYQDYTANFARKFVTDPENTLKPFIEDVAMQKAQELVNQHLGQYKAQTYVADLEKQNSDWLYNPDGSVSREGQAIQGYIQQASQIGISSPEARWQYATGMLQRDLLNLRYQQMQSAMQPAAYAAQVPSTPPQPIPPADPVEQSNMQFLRERATRTPNRSAGNTEPRAPRQRMSFEDRLRSQLVNDGVI